MFDCLRGSPEGLWPFGGGFRGQLSLYIVLGRCEALNFLLIPSVETYTTTLCFVNGLRGNVGKGVQRAFGPLAGVLGGRAP